MSKEDIVKRALATFRKPYNCAQTVYAAIEGADAAKLDELKSMGGGRAPDGLCGALYAAKLVAGKADEARIEAEFKTRTSSVKCKEIKSVYKTPCETCVQAAIEALK